MVKSSNNPVRKEFALISSALEASLIDPTHFSAPPLIVLDAVHQKQRVLKSRSAPLAFFIRWIALSLDEET
jgi:hypothetical protein